ncbi:MULTISPECIES: ImcF-related family protein [unclassified Caballeronia]|uniref:ImcF-related family protein n=1 Tax=unclassified Caballeronia TaxID=2646786 RepID=UPI002028F231|nr:MULTISPECIES: ImcF-related family protein [unclassified Caballeronia]MDR5769103.1 ImcF-related family protein [Caballeronia sp. LZ028]
MKNKYTWGRWLILAGISLAAVFFIYLTVDGPALSAWLSKYRGYLLATMASLLLVLGFVLPKRTQVRRSLQSVSKSLEFEPPQAKTDATDATSSVYEARINALRHRLIERHGRRWRYRERWLLAVGGEDHVKHLAPELVEAGFALVGGVVLLYSRQTANDLDTEWLSRIRKLRPRRPIDAIVAVTAPEGRTGDAFDADSIGQYLAHHARVLHWSAPTYLLNVKECGGAVAKHSETIGILWSEARADKSYLDNSLVRLGGELSTMGVARLSLDPYDRLAAEFAQHMETWRTALSDVVMRVGSSRVWRVAIHGLLFAPITSERSAEDDRRVLEDRSDSQNFATSRHGVWQTIAAHSRKIHGRRVGFCWSTSTAWVSVAAVALWVVGTLISGASNRASIQNAAATLDKLGSAQGTTQTLTVLDRLDKQLDTLEVHRTEGAPWHARFGLNHDAALLDALKPGYQSAASRILIAPIQAKLEERLRQLASLSDAEIASGGNAQVQAAYDTLKTYLMLAHPEHADASFLSAHMLATNAPARPSNASVTPGTWEDTRQHAIAFYASHLKRDSAAAITPDVALVAAARQTIIGVRGIQNSTDAIYQQIIEETKPKYPPVTLATLLGDHPSRGLFNTTATVPGVFTRAAWDERIPKAIDEASEQRTVTGDWVLSDAKLDNTAPTTLKAELRQRYFNDYTRAWALFLNSIRWQSASSLSGTVDQLTLLGDPQRSPIVALMNAIVYQASAGASTQSLSDNLIAKAQQWAGKDEKDPSKQAQPQLAPLAVAFGPILRLAGADLTAPAPANAKSPTQSAALGELSLPRYLERVTAMRLKTQQMMASADPDAMSRAAAQAVLQGKTSDIADSRDYASRLAASLGEQWSGFGRLFEAPLEQTWQVVVQPASSSLNEIWRTSILADWNRAFGGRYPFADSDNDASLPDVARFMRMDNGVIAQFVATELAGVVKRQGDQWVAAQGSDQGTLTLDPAFLAALNKLTRVSTALFPSGDARVRFELRGAPTPGITDMKLVSSGQQLHYFNQMEQWVPFEWPGQALDNDAQLQWETEEGGLRSTMYAQGRFALIRLMERAKVSQQDNARYVLSWTPDQGVGPALSVQLRAESGAGPLDVLALRHFTLPTHIFMTKSVAERGSGPNPPPLPPGAFSAAQKVGVPLPGGR